jgi:hypothetical protein
MNKMYIGFWGLIISSLVLSMQMYGLSILQGMDKASGSWETNALSYAAQTPVSLALMLTVGVMVLSVVLIYLGIEEKNKSSERRD